MNEIKFTYIIAIVLMMFFVAFIILIVVLYNRRQLFFIQQQQLKESEYQNQLLQKELEKQKSIEKERERISHDMHDDLGAGISALKLHAEFLKQKAEDEDLKTDINELLKTSEEMSISMREMLWSLNSGNDTVGSFVEYAKLYAQNFLKKTKIQLIVEDESTIFETTITTEQRRNLFLCLKEALNNAYKHSQSDQLKLSFIQKDKEFLMKISDNGVGFSQGKADGNGLRNMKQRMQEQNGHCDVTTENGTHLFFRIDLQSN
ncbi:Sensor histidine kinase DesK [Chryseobacterium aquaeductus]|uniref:histidine kinase n=1 Tax=Chryseobacterium aquaeductus TaxID=2675056 RepID=A0A9N8MF71_9FLAO|nr:histidine kinase [Chryseobacterium aquaeductus]CAA7330390.1 Sensor histidine kinase DesK [Chryseobacterium potabilaquae]CAD7803301.1 Sensor histidine kinase DesK [Chryseobacterium aquaeductus]